MPLRLNLYHEVILAKKQEQYDPVKISLLGTILVAACLSGYYFVKLSNRNSAVSAAAAAQMEYDKLSPQAAKEQAREAALISEITLAERLTSRIEGRMYWAPVLEHIAGVVPRNVQIVKLSGEVVRQSSPRWQMVIEGSAAGAEPRRIAEELRTALVERLGASYQNVNAIFKTLEDSNERVTLDGKQFATSVFSIGVSFEIKDAAKQEASGAGATGGIAQKN